MLQQTSKKRVLFVRSLALSLLVLFGVFFVFFVGLLTGHTAHAFGAGAPSSTINFQARLEAKDGAIAPDGNYNIEFKLYDAATGGTNLWTEDYTYNSGAGATDARVRVADGYLTVNLGSITPFPNTINWDQQLYLTMNIGGTVSSGTITWDGEMTPRLQLTAVPYAFQAQSAQQLQTLQGGYGGTLQFGSLTANQTITLPNATGTVALTNDATDFIRNQTSQQASSNFNISGTGVANILQASTFDTASAGTLNIGTTNATGINLGQNTSIANNKSFTANGSALFQDATNSTSAFSIQNASSSPIFTVDSTDQFVGINTSGPSASLDVQATAGTFFDGFESGTLSPFTTSTPSEWVVTNVAPVYSGSFSLRGTGGSQGTHYNVSLTQTLTSTGSVSFYYNCSWMYQASITFTIDSGAANYLSAGCTNMSANSNWQQASFTGISAGTHTFTWGYSGGPGSQIDSGFQYNIDNVVVTNAGAAGTAALFNGGNVGIGNHAPSALLSVGSTSQFQVDASGNLQTSGTATVTGLLTANGGVSIATGKDFVNGGSTLNSSKALSLAASGAIGTAAATVDAYTTFDVTATAASLSFTLPSPTVTTSGRIVYINNVGTNTFSIDGATLNSGASANFIWNGTAWTTTAVSTGVSLVGTIDTQTANANGATIVGNTLYLQSASTTNPGLINTGTQSFSGAKGFNGNVAVASTSTTAFMIQTTGGASTLLSADTTNSRISIGNIGTPTGQLYVSGSKASGALGAVATGSSPYGVAVQGNYAYVANYGANTLQVIDISNPASPLSVTTVATGTNPYWLTISGHYLYLTNSGSSSLQIFDISTPASPVLISTVATASQPYAVVVQGHYVYVSNETVYSIQVFDVLNPAIPILVGSTNTNGRAYGMAISGKYLYTAEQGPGNSMEIFDISDPIAPVLKSKTFPTGTNSFYSIAVHGHYAYVADESTTNSVRAFDVSNPASPTQVGVVGNGIGFYPYSIAISGRYLYEAADNYLVTIDISNPASMGFVGTVNLGGMSTGLAVQGRYAYVTNNLGPSLSAVDLGGAYLQQLQAGSTQTGNLTVNTDASVGGSLNVQGGIGANSINAGNIGTNQLTVAASPTSLPTILLGTQNSSGSTLTAYNNYIIASQFTSGSTSSTATYLNVYFGNTDASPNNEYQMALYSDNAGAPGTLLATSPVGIINANGWSSIAIPSTTIAANTKYWLAFNENGHDTQIVYSGSCSLAYISHAFTSGFPSTYPTGGSTGSACYDMFASAAPVVGNYNVFQVQNAQGINLAGANTQLNTLGIGGLSAPDFNDTDAATSVNQPTLATAGTAGTTSYSYEVASSLNCNGSTVISEGSPVATITTGNATLSATNYNTISWTNASYEHCLGNTYIYRTASGGSPNGTGLIAIVPNGTTSLNDTGLAVISTNIPATTNNLTANTTYWYVITALDGAGGETLPSSSVNVKTGATGRAVTLNWPVINGARGYNIYRNTADSNYQFIGTTTKAYYIDTGATAPVDQLPPVISTAYQSQLGNGTNSQISIGAGTPQGQVFVGGALPNTPLAKLPNPNDVGNGYITGSALYKGYWYTYEPNGHGFYVVDVSNPANPKFVSTGNVTIRSNLVVAGHYLYFGSDGQYGDPSFGIMDLSNPANPTYVGGWNYNNTGTYGSIAVQGNYAYISNTTNIQVLDISNPKNPTLVSSYNGLSSIYDIKINGHYMYATSNVASGSALQVFDISNPTAPALVGSLAANKTAGGLYDPQNIAVNGHYLYIGGYDSGSSTSMSWVVDASNPAAPQVIGSFPVGNDPAQMEVAGNRLYIQNQYGSYITVDDISDPANPTIIGSMAGGVDPGSFVIQGRYLYLTPADYNEPNYYIYDLGGTYTQSLQAGNTQTDTLTVSQDANIGGSLNIQGGATVQQSLQAGNIATGGLTINSPQATPAVVVGDNTLGSQDSGDRNQMTGGQFTASTSTTVRYLNIYVGNTDTAPNNQFQMAIYADNGSNAPGSLIVASGSGTLQANSWNSVAITPTVLTSGTKYWIIYNSNSTSSTLDQPYMAGSGAPGIWLSQTYGTWPATFGAGNSQTGLAAYASTTPVSAGIPALQIQNSVNANLLSVNSYTGVISFGGFAAPINVTATLGAAGGSLAASTTYYYVVTAIDAQGGESNASVEAYATTNTTNKQITVAWNAVAGATSYRVYRGTVTGGENTYFATTSTSYNDTGAASTAGSPPSNNNSGAIHASSMGLTIQPASNNSKTFQVQNASGQDLLTVNSVNGTVEIGTPNDAATVGAEMFTTSYSFPATTGWTALSGTGQTATATHTAGGGTTALSPTPALPIVAGNTYQISFTVSGASGNGVDYMTPSIGGNNGPRVIEASGSETQVIMASNTANLAFKPTTGWTGTITNVSVKLITNSKPALQILDSAGNAAIDIRSGGVGNLNSFIGLESGESNTSGQYNTAVGGVSLAGNTTGSWNTAVGTGALDFNTTGVYNTAIGGAALDYNTSGSSNVAIGFSSGLSNTIGQNNTYTGVAAGYSDSTGSNNTGFGNGALYYTTTGSGNLGLGYSALNGNTTGSNNIGIGSYAGHQDLNGEFLTSPNLQNSAAIGAYAQVQASNTIVLGSVDNPTQIVVGATVPVGTNSFGVSPVDLNSTTITASQTSGSGTVTASAAIFSSSNVGEELVWADGTTETITAYTDSTHVTGSSTSIAETNSYFRTHHIGFQVTNTGNTYVQTNSSNAFQVQNAAGSTLLNANTSTSNVSVSGGQSSDWTSQTAPVGASAVIYADSKFVAVGTNTPYVMTSPDGVTWTAQTAPAGSWYSVTYAAGKFVAVGYSSPYVMTSPDGVTWTAQTAPASDWYSLTYGNGAFVATSDSSPYVMTSPDGVTWTAQTAPAGSWYSATYGNNMFVAVSQYAPYVMTSPDGVTWTPQITPVGGNWGSVAYENGEFVAVGTNAPYVMTSPNGIAWTTQTAPASNWNSVAYNNGTFVAVSQYGPPYVMTAKVPATTPAFSVSGGAQADTLQVGTGSSTSSALQVNGSTMLYGNLTANGNVVVQTSINSTTAFQIQNSSNVSVLTADTVNQQIDISGGSYANTPSFRAQTAPNDTWNSVTYGNGTFVAISQFSPYAMTSPDSINWTASTNPFLNTGHNAVTYGNGAFVAVGGVTNSYAINSSDGVNWNNTSAPAGSWQSVTYGNGKFVAVEAASPYVMTSPDGQTWTTQTAPAGNWSSVTYGNGKFVAVSYYGSSPYVMTSPDGVTWTAQTAPMNANEVIYANSKFVAAGNAGAMTSPDGVTWTSQTTSAVCSRSIGYGNGSFVAVGSSCIMTSPDGITWTRQPSLGGNWYSVTYADNTFVAVGSYPAVAISPDNAGLTALNISGGTYSDSLSIGAGAKPANSSTKLQVYGNTSLHGTVTTTVNSTTAFQVQNDSGTSLLTADTVNSRVSIGSIGTPTGQLYVSGSVPTSSLSGLVSAGSNPLDIAVQGNYAYITDKNSNTLKVFDVSNPASPTNIGNVAGTNNPLVVTVQGNYAYVASSGTLQIFDVSNPASPTSVGSVNTGTTATAITVQGRYAYLASNSSSALQIFDISTPANPVSVGSVAMSVNATSVAVQGNYAYLLNATSNTLQIFDVSNPASPTSVGSIATGTNPYSVTVQGAYAYVINNTSNTLQIFNVSNPASPTSVGSVSTDAGPKSLVIQGHYAYVVNSSAQTLQIFDISNPASPTSVGRYNTLSNPVSIAVQGRYAYAIINYSLQTFDLGGAYTQQLQAGGTETGTLQVDSNATVGGSLSVQSGLGVSGASQFNGDVGISGQVSIGADSSSALLVQNAAGTAKLLNVDAKNQQVTIGSGTSGAISSVQEWEALGTNQSTVAVTAHTAGNLMTLSVLTQSSVTVTAVSGGGVTTWTKVNALTNGVDRVEMWQGTVTTAGASTITVTYSGTPGGGSELVAQEFTAGLGASTNWSVITSATASDSTSTSFGYPSLTASAAGELYYGYGVPSNVGAAGTTPGFSYIVTPNNNVMAYNTNLTSGLAYAPSAAQSPAGTADVISAIFKASSPSTTNLTVNGLTTLNGATTVTGQNSTTAFQVQNASGASIFNIDTTTGMITIGDIAGGNDITISSNGVTAYGTARHVKILTFEPEYAGAVLDAQNDSTCTSATNGTMTSGFDGVHSYYNWTSTQATAQCYDVVLRVPVPSDFGAWDPDTAGTVLRVNGYTTNTTNGTLSVQVLNPDGSVRTAWASVPLSTANAWHEVGQASGVVSWTPGQIFTLQFRMSASNSANLRLGTVQLYYYTNY